MPSHSGKFRLKALDFDEVSLVTSGDDPMALQVLFKSAPEVVEDKLTGLDAQDFAFLKARDKKRPFFRKTDARAEMLTMMANSMKRRSLAQFDQQRERRRLRPKP